MEHVSLTDPIAIFDCIEFNDRLRFSDTFADIGFLMMDLDYHGGRYFSQKVWDLYCSGTGDSRDHPLITFYKVYRAYVRGKVNSFQIEDTSITPDKREGAVQKARKYFKLAAEYVEE